MPTIPLNMTNCKAGGFFNQRGGANWNPDCCAVLKANNATSQAPAGKCGTV